MAMNKGFAAFLAKKKASKGAVAPVKGVVAPKGVVMAPMHPAMVRAIKQSPKGVIPPGLARYLAAKKAAKGGK